MLGVLNRGNEMQKATRETAEKIIEVLSHGLSSGLGSPIKGHMCVEAAVCYAMGLPHSDEPVCVSPAIRAFKIKLNDSAWSNNIARANGMRRLAIAQLNSAGAVDDKEFTQCVVDLAIRKIIPFALREAAKIHPDQNHKDALDIAAKRCEVDGDRDAAARATYAAADAARASYAAARAADASYAASRAADAARAADASYAASRAADAARAAADAAYAAHAAADAAYAAYAAADAADAAGAANARDKFLAFAAEEVVQILIDMKAPGTEWLDLAPLQAIAN
jgi:hypothetical protein